MRVVVTAGVPIMGGEISMEDQEIVVFDEKAFKAQWEESGWQRVDVELLQP